MQFSIIFTTKFDLFKWYLNKQLVYVTVIYMIFNPLFYFSLFFPLFNTLDTYYPTMSICFLFIPFSLTQCALWDPESVTLCVAYDLVWLYAEVFSRNQPSSISQFDNYRESIYFLLWAILMKLRCILGVLFIFPILHVHAIPWFAYDKC